MRNIIFFIPLLLLGCNQNTPHIQIENWENSNINIEIQEKVVFKTDSIFIVDLMISPIDSNKIWVFNKRGSAYELGLKDTSWTSLNKRFGKYSSRIKSENLFYDDWDANLIWIGNFHKGLIAYDIAKNSYLEFPEICPISSTLFLKESVFFGTWRGLYKFDRSSDTAIKIVHTSGIHVNAIEKINKNELLINYEYRYNHKTDSDLTEDSITKEIYSRKTKHNFQLISYFDDVLNIHKDDILKSFTFPNFSFKNIIVDEEVIWLPYHDLADGIKKYSFPENKTLNIYVGYDFVNYKIANDNDYIWFFKGNKVLCLSKSDNSIKSIDLEFSINHLIVDPNYVYMNTWHSIEIWSKDYLLDNAISIEEVVNEEAEFSNLLGSIRIYSDSDFSEYYERYKQLQIAFQNTSNSRILEKLSSLKKSIPYRIPYDKIDLKQLNKEYLDKIEEDDIKASVYVIASKHANYKANFKESLTIDSILLKNYPQYRTDIHIFSIDKIKEYYPNIKNLETSDLSGDGYLWKIGNAYYELFRYVGPRTEASTADMTLPFQFFKNLVEEYPDSEYADNAEIFMFTYREQGSHEGGYIENNLMLVNEYKKLLAKYPNTEQKPYVYHNICRLYVDPFSSFEERTIYLNLAKEYAQKILVEFPDYEHTEEVRNDLAAIEQKLPQTLWKLEIESNKKVYSPDEPIYITFSLKNIDDKPKQIKLSTVNKIPNFIIFIEKYPFDAQSNRGERLKLERDINTYIEHRLDSTILPNQIYTAKWDIKKIARRSFSGGQGSYNIREEGRYRVESYAGSNSIPVPSNVIWFSIKNNE